MQRECAIPRASQHRATGKENSDAIRTNFESGIARHCQQHVGAFGDGRGRDYGRGRQAKTNTYAHTYITPTTHANTYACTGAGVLERCRPAQHPWL